MNSTEDRDLVEQLVADCLARGEEDGDWQLDDVCRGHPTLRDAVERVLRSLDAFGLTEAEADPTPQLSGFGDYRVIRELGRGAMGVVHLAEQRSLGRQVALKRLGSHLSLGTKGLTRFRREAELLSRIEHPHIAAIYEAGESEGVPYLAMQFVDGETLAARIARRVAVARPAEIGFWIECIEQLARALSSAHAAGVVHRDVKPGNVLLDRQSRPVLVDFGLARIADSDSGGLTRSGDSLGTPAYMAPEQIDPGRGEVGVATDVYGLGATAWECLTGRPPFEAPTRDALYLLILRGERPSLRDVLPGCSRDLAVVIERSMAVEPGERFATAAEFADELVRIREHRPILSRAPSPIDRSRMWARRNPVAATWLIVATLALFGSLWTAVRLGQAGAKERILKTVRLVERTVDDPLVRSQWFVAQLGELPGDPTLSGALRESLGQIRELRSVKDLPGAMDTVLVAGDRVVAGGEAAGVWLYDERLQPIVELRVAPLPAADAAALGYDSLAGQGGEDIYQIEARSIAMSADGSRIAVGCSRGAFAVFDAQTGRQLGATLRGQAGQRWKVMNIEFGPSGEWIVVTHADGTVGVWSLEGERRADLRMVHDGAMTAWGDPQDRPASRAHPVTAWATAVSPDGERVVTGAGGGRGPNYEGQEKSLRIWDRRTGRCLTDPIEFHTATIWDLACSNERIVTASEDGRTALFDHHGKQLAVHRDNSAWVRARFSADGASYVVTSEDGAILWARSSDGEPLARWKGHATVADFEIGPDAETLLTVSYDRSITLYSAQGEELLSIGGHEQPVTSVEWIDAERGLLVTGSEDASLRLWSLHPTMVDAFWFDYEGVRALRRLADGRLLVVGAFGRLALLSADGELLREARVSGEPRKFVSLDEARGIALVTTLGGEVFSWSYEAEDEAVELYPDTFWTMATHGSEPGVVCLTVGGGIVRVREIQPGRLPWIVAPSYDGPHITAISSRVDRGELLFGRFDGTVALVAEELGAEPRVLYRFGSLVRFADFAAGGRLLMAAGSDGVAVVIDRDSGEVVVELRGHQSVIDAVDLDQEAGLIATACRDGRIRVWRFPEGGEPLVVFGDTSDAMRGVAILGREGRVLSLRQNGQMRWWWTDSQGSLDDAKRRLPPVDEVTRTRYPDLFGR